MNDFANFAFWTLTPQQAGDEVGGEAPEPGGGILIEGFKRVGGEHEKATRFKHAPDFGQNAAFAFDAGKSIAAAARDAGAEAFVNNPIFIIAMAGGFTTNFLWCLALNIRNKSITDYVTGPTGQTAANYGLAGLAGVIWYLQFFFYGMGTTKLGEEFGFSSWTVHMAFIIVFSNLWGIRFKEWKGVSRPTMLAVWAGISVLILSTMVIGLGNYWKEA